MESYIALAVFVYIVSTGFLCKYMVETNKDISIYTIFCPVINTIAVFVLIIKFIIKAIKGLIKLITKI